MVRLPHLWLLLVLAATAGATGCVNEMDDGADGIEPEDLKDNLELQGVYDCTETENNGYRQGSRFDITVVHADGRPVETLTANAYIAMQNAARDAGVSLRIVSGFRTMSEQHYLYGCYTNCNCNSCNLAARPGYSNHQSGHALDLNTSESGVLSWLNNHGAAYGFSRTVPSESWHWEWWGDDNDFSGPCGGSAAVDELPAGCTKLPAAGGTVEEEDSCFVPGGPSEYLRSIDQGSGGASLWTNTTAATHAANFGEWWINVREDGRYRLEIYDLASVATSKTAAYNVTSKNGDARKVVDLTAHPTGFVSLGEFEFDAATPGRVRIGDNTGEGGSNKKKLVLDALRVTRVDVDPDPQPDPTQQDTCSQVQVHTSGTSLNIRPAPNTNGSPVGSLQNGAVVDHLDTVDGQAVSGNSTWHKIRKGNVTGYVSGAFTSCM